MSAAKGQPGRRPGMSDGSVRYARFLAAGWLLAGHTTEAVAKAFGVSRRTVFRWKAEALAEDGPDGDAIRNLAAGRD